MSIKANYLKICSRIFRNFWRTLDERLKRLKASKTVSTFFTDFCKSFCRANWRKVHQKVKWVTNNFAKTRKKVKSIIEELLNLGLKELLKWRNVGSIGRVETLHKLIVFYWWFLFLLKFPFGAQRTIPSFGQKIFYFELNCTTNFRAWK